jgi:hypothetical protein
MKCIINNQVILSRPPEGPLAAQIGSFAKSMSDSRDTVCYRFIARFCSLHVLVSPSKWGESWRCIASACVLPFSATR